MLGKHCNKYFNTRIFSTFFFCYYIGMNPRWRLGNLKNKAILSFKIGSVEVLLERFEVARLDTRFSLDR